ncbi:aldehyde dehydrogenase family protein, partial [Kocuria aegyptia]|uniref:aldehyde dehydrogenase family protein n=1 Tax=Kocuria aegyptia TaxID=330943 RepID=UPI0031D426EA
MQNTKQDAEARAQQAAEHGTQDPGGVGEVIEHFIDGARHGGSARTAEVYNPATGQVARRVLLASAEEVATAVEAAELALPGWRATG